MPCWTVLRSRLHSQPQINNHLCPTLTTATVREPMGFQPTSIVEKSELSFSQVTMVCEYEDVFYKIPRLPLKPETDFSIDLIPGMSPISIAPY